MGSSGHHDGSALLRAERPPDGAEATAEGLLVDPEVGRVDQHPEALPGRAHSSSTSITASTGHT